jgi:hypothetical protein
MKKHIAFDEDILHSKNALLVPSNAILARYKTQGRFY